MAIRSDCPRCKQPLSVPNKKAGGYVNCPRCQGRFWVPKDAPGDVSPSESVTVAANTPPGETAGAWSATPSRGVPVSAAARQTPSSSPALPGVAPSRAPAAIPTASPSATPAAPIPPPVMVQPAAERKVARLIASEAAQSALPLAADGQLPTLQLAEGEKKEKAESRSATSNPLVLLAVLCLSAVLSVALVLMETETSPVEAGQKQQQVRQHIEDHFFGGGLDRRDLVPYQVYLREAQQAHSRGDRNAERRYYRKVLDLLRAERAGHQQGLTGSQGRDRELENLVVSLLSEDG